MNIALHRIECPQYTKGLTYKTEASLRRRVYPLLYIPPNPDSRLHRPNCPRRLLSHRSRSHRSRPRRRRSRRRRSDLPSPPKKPPKPIRRRPQNSPRKPRRSPHTKDEPHRQQRLRNRIRRREPIRPISQTPLPPSTKLKPTSKNTGIAFG